ncbi:hypothetical protein [Gelidibacter sp. F63206]|uniref:hypothetical protein n=1 Tax=Gelidibacter sp. F63206 TaxID=2926425 RepID=UPI001FF5DEC3|nr:hypothetical protein [Gelidibacter sp. F63206]MCK0114972.1 hypothetical protein [Gelidibacter sp. F63206]
MKNALKELLNKIDELETQLRILQILESINNTQVIEPIKPKRNYPVLTNLIVFKNNLFCIFLVRTK